MHVSRHHLDARLLRAVSREKLMVRLQVQHAGSLPRVHGGTFVQVPGDTIGVAGSEEETKEKKKTKSVKERPVANFLRLLDKAGLSPRSRREHFVPVIFTIPRKTKRGRGSSTVVQTILQTILLLGSDTHVSIRAALLSLSVVKTRAPFSFE